VVELVRGSNAPQQALDRAREYASVARESLDGVPEGEARDALAALTDYVVIRKL
jgi:geranylgeranyl pyrophosphate synthase